MSETNKRILIIDDDLELCELLEEYLTPEGFAIDTAQDGESGAEKALQGGYGLVILDVMLPGMSGFEVLRRVRAESRVAVIMLTARGDEVDRIVGLEMGADDYLAKPFNPRELVARIRAVQRRFRDTEGSGHRVPGAGLTVGDVVLDERTRTVKQGGAMLTLTAVEFSLLTVLMRHAGEVVSREDLVQSVLGRAFSPYDRSIDVHVSNLRRKLGPYPDRRERIKTVRGTGYQYLLPMEENRAAP